MTNRNAPAVKRLLPPRSSNGAASRTSTRAPSPRAARAAHMPALPAPTTTTSNSPAIIWFPPLALACRGSTAPRRRGQGSLAGRRPRRQQVQWARSNGQPVDFASACALMGEEPRAQQLRIMANSRNAYASIGLAPDGYLAAAAGAGGE